MAKLTLSAFLRSLRTSLVSRYPDCLILDLHMPGISGLDLLRHLSQIGLSVPTIIITAPEDPEKQCLTAGAVAHLQKPIDEQVLLAAIASASRTNNLPCAPVLWDSYRTGSTGG